MTTRQPSAPTDALTALHAELVVCRRCPRLVAWREDVARTKRAAFADQEYWGRPVPGFGDPEARLVIVGLAPAAHGANRTGRMFTGDRSGEVLFAALHRAGLANQPHATHVGDGLRLTGVFITAPVRCAPPANLPTSEERASCAPWMAAELALLPVRAVLALGAIGWDAAVQQLAQRAGLPPPRPRPRFGHGAETTVGDVALLGCYHVSQQNTFTGRLTPAMLDGVLARARVVAES